MTALESFHRYLASGNRVTTRQARTLFKVENVADLAYRLRNEGVPVYTNRVTTSRGHEAFAYRIGEPSRAFLGHMESRHIARARKALYRQALSA
jgi:Helix-turn-helix domain